MGISSLLQNLYSTALNTYHVNPIVFAAIYIISIPFFYLTFYFLVRELLALKRDSNLGRSKRKDHFKNISFWGAALFFVYVAPYFYVLIFGEKLPVFIWFLITVFLVITSALLFINIQKAQASGNSNEEKIIWKIYSYCYDGLLGLKPYKSLILKMLYEAELKPGESVLDIGVGTGNLEALNDVSEVRFTCLDFSEHMMARAKKKNPNEVYALYDINKNRLPAPRSSFDKVLSCNVIYNVRNLDEFFLDLYGVLKPGGNLIFSTSIESGLLPIVKEHFKESSARENLALVFKIPAITAITIINLIIDKSSSYYFYPEKTLVRAVENAGFDIIKKDLIYGGLNTLIVAKKPA